MHIQKLAGASMHGRQASRGVALRQPAVMFLTRYAYAVRRSINPNSMGEIRNTP